MGFFPHSYPHFMFAHSSADFVFSLSYTSKLLEIRLIVKDIVCLSLFKKLNYLYLGIFFIIYPNYK